MAALAGTISMGDGWKGALFSVTKRKEITRLSWLSIFWSRSRKERAKVSTVFGFAKPNSHHFITVLCAPNNYILQKRANGNAGQSPGLPWRPSKLLLQENVCMMGIRRQEWAHPAHAWMNHSTLICCTGLYHNRLQRPIWSGWNEEGSFPGCIR